MEGEMLSRFSLSDRFDTSDEERDVGCLPSDEGRRLILTFV